MLFVLLLTASATRAEASDFCKDVTRQPRVDTDGLTKAVLTDTVPFHEGHTKENVRAAYAPFFEGYVKPAADLRRSAAYGRVLNKLPPEVRAEEERREACRTVGESFRFASIGVWYFFNHADLVRTIRIEAPFAKTYRGVRIGMTRDEVLEALGTPMRIFEFGEDEALVFDLKDGPDKRLRVDIDRETKTVLRIID